MRLNAQLHHKQSEYNTSPCVVEKIIELPKHEFLSICHAPLRHCAFITENADLMHRDANGVYHCLMVLGEDCDDGILIEAEGYDYARKSAFVPGARQIMFMEQRYNCIQDLESCLMDVVDEMTSCANAHTNDGSGEPYRALISDLMEQHQFDEQYIPLMLEMLGEHSGLEYVMDNGEIVLYTNYRQEEKEKSYYKPTDDELEIMKAKHILWNHDQPGGELADFTNSSGNP
jgi:hypothetical protein